MGLERVLGWLVLNQMRQSDAVRRGESGGFLNRNIEVSQSSDALTLTRRW
jgi:hypothetical protein